MITLEKKGVMTSKSCAANDAANVQITVRFKLNGLRKKFIKKVSIRLCDTVHLDRYYDYQRDAYCTDIYKADGTFLRTLYGDTIAECNGAYVEWCSREGGIILHVEDLIYYQSPDGFVGTMADFQYWAEQGHLHGLTAHSLIK